MKQQSETPTEQKHTPNLLEIITGGKSECGADKNGLYLRDYPDDLQEPIQFPPVRTKRKNIHTRKYYKDRAYKQWARLYEPSEQCRQYRRKNGIL